MKKLEYQGILSDESRSTRRNLHRSLEGKLHETEQSISEFREMMFLMFYFLHPLVTSVPKDEKGSFRVSALLCILMAPGLNGSGLSTGER